MSTLIVYASKYGCTEKCAKVIAQELDVEVNLFNLRSNRSIDLSSYDQLIIGGSLYMGKIQKSVKKFCHENKKALLHKKIGLFICGISEGEVAKKELARNFPEELLHAAIKAECFGGELVISQLNFFDKFILEKLAKMTDQSTLSLEKCKDFARSMK